MQCQKKDLKLLLSNYKDVAYYFYCLSIDSLKLVKNYSSPQKSDYKSMKDYKDFKIMADLYYSYDIIFKYIEEPFSKDLIHVGPHGLFNACKFIVNKLSNFNSSHQLKGVIVIIISALFIICLLRSSILI